MDWWKRRLKGFGRPTLQPPEDWVGHEAMYAILQFDGYGWKHREDIPPIYDREKAIWHARLIATSEHPARVLSEHKAEIFDTAKDLDSEAVEVVTGRGGE